MRRVVRIGAIHAADRADLQRRLHRLHRADLHRRRLRAEQQLARDLAAEEEVVGRPARRMAIRNVQRVEVVPLVLELGSVCDRETHATEHIDDLVDRLGQHMARALAHRDARLGDVDGWTLRRSGRRVLLAIERAFDRGLDLVHALADRGLLLLRHGLERVHRGAQAAVGSEPAHAESLERGGIHHGVEFGQRFAFHRVEIREHRISLTQKQRRPE